MDMAYFADNNGLFGRFGGEKKKILVIDDDDVARTLLTGLLEATEHYTVLTGENGADGIHQAITESPDVILLDIMMPKIDGFEVCRILRADIATRYIPIVMLSAKSGVDVRIEGLSMGADDYIIKPFNHAELIARLDALLRRNEISLDANPLTRLPGNISIEREIIKRMAESRPFAVGYADLDNFKAFNDRYGFLKGDQIIFDTGHIIRQAVDRHDFVGHIGGDDFVFIAPPEKIDAICHHIIHAFDDRIPAYYDDASRRQGYIESLSRNGDSTRFNLMTISIAVVTNQDRAFTHFAEISEIGAELKKYLKSLNGSKYLIDRRKNEYSDI